MGGGGGSLTAQRVEHLEAPVNLLLGIVAYRTSIQKDGICLVKRLCRLVACHLHDAGYDLRVGYVHLAAVCLNI